MCHCRNSIKFISTFAASYENYKNNNKMRLEGTALTVMFGAHNDDDDDEVAPVSGQPLIAFDVTDPNRAYAR